jgi:hypothetical protein
VNDLQKEIEKNKNSQDDTSKECVLHSNIPLDLFFYYTVIKHIMEIDNKNVAD